MNNFLFKKIDNGGLVLFRAIFGLLITLEGFGAIATGWVKRTLVEPKFTFNFIGFDFLQQLQGPFVYVLFVALGVFGIGVMLGYRYRFSMLGYAIIWTTVYLMQKTSYNNHYYLLMLLCWIMVFLPAHRYFSLDVKRRPELKSTVMPQWVKLIIILQIAIVYGYATLAKFYPAWLDGTAVSIFLAGKKDYWLIGSLLQNRILQIIMTYGGIFFDLFIVPMLLWRRTRFFAFCLSIGFHLFNSIVFQIGIFPFLSISFALFFFSPETLKKTFLPLKSSIQAQTITVPKFRKLGITLFSIYFIFQLGLPLRHWFFKDDVLWTEEGHRLSWRMMLRSKSGYFRVVVEDKTTGERKTYKHQNLLTSKQSQSVPTKPDLLWQLAQKIKLEEAKAGRDVAVYISAYVSVNRSDYFPFIDDQVDLASEPWSHWKHSEWILPSPKNLHHPRNLSQTPN